MGQCWRVVSELRLEIRIRVKLRRARRQRRCHLAGVPGLVGLFRDNRDCPQALDPPSRPFYGLTFYTVTAGMVSYAIGMKASVSPAVLARAVVAGAKTGMSAATRRAGVPQGRNCGDNHGSF